MVYLRKGQTFSAMQKYAIKCYMTEKNIPLILNNL